MKQVLHYIFSKNSLGKAFQFLGLAVCFQLFKRVTGATVSKKIFNGNRLFLYPNCNVSTFFVYTDQPDKKEISYLRSIITEKDFFFDIGANVGSYSVCLMDICSNVIAFEPHPFTANRCRMNFLLNGLPASSVKQLALSDKTGETFFSDIGHSSTVNSITNDPSGIRVEMTTLDQFVKKNPQFTRDQGYVLKIDVEGFEKQVLEGGKNFLSEYPVKGMILECFQTDEIFPILQMAGFTRFEKCSENNYIISK